MAFHVPRMSFDQKNERFRQKQGIKLIYKDINDYFHARGINRFFIKTTTKIHEK